MVDARAPAVVQDRGGVVGVGSEVDEADHGGRVQAAGGVLDAFEGGEILRDEGAAQQEVLRRVARDGQLGQHDEVAGGGLRVADGGEDAIHVAVEVSDGGVDLGESDAKAAHGASSGPGAVEDSAAPSDRTSTSCQNDTKSRPL